MHHLTSLSHGHFSLSNRCLARIRRLENLLEFFQCFPCRFHKELQEKKKSINIRTIYRAVSLSLLLLLLFVVMVMVTVFL